MSYSQYLKSKGIQTGCEWILKVKITSSALDIFENTATFVAQVRTHNSSTHVLAELSTANGLIRRVDGNTLELTIPAETSANWESGQVVLDVLRTDYPSPIHLGFDLSIPVKRTITRL